jgi:hypothetical protein
MPLGILVRLPILHTLVQLVNFLPQLIQSNWDKLSVMFQGCYIPVESRIF